MQLFFKFRTDRSHLCEGLEAACFMACRGILADFENTQTNNILFNAFFLFELLKFKQNPLSLFFYGVQLYPFYHSCYTAFCISYPRFSLTLLTT